uniref:Uncharacterized protein n=1 Tax=Nelumbo nucifera TaxID=4432 RepID=A0A822ZUX9_NELNU|nr:TPA_asm: hypothetical protein HUJ06_017036 [Nelumbo nucifera]
MVENGGETFDPENGEEWQETINPYSETFALTNFRTLNK